MKEHVISKGKSKISIFPTYGACINELVLDGKQILRYAKDEADVQNLTVGAFNGAQLFPFPNRLSKGVYRHNDQDFELPLNDNPAYHNALHGLVFDQAFKLTQLQENEIKTVLDSQGFQGFPFAFKLENTFSISDTSLSIHTVIENTGENSFPYGHGWHPYFDVSNNVEKCQLKLPVHSSVPVNNNLIPEGEPIPYQAFKALKEIENTALDTCFLCHSANERIIFKNPVAGFSIEIILDGYDHLQVYIPPEKDAIAIEPQTCQPDAFNNGFGLKELKPAELANYRMAIALV